MLALYLIIFLSEDDIRAFCNGIGCLSIDIILHLVSETLELDVNGVLVAFIASSCLVTKLTHEDKLLEQALIGVLFAATRACIVHQVCKQIVVVLLLDVLEYAKCVLG